VHQKGFLGYDVVRSGRFSGPKPALDLAPEFNSPYDQSVAAADDRAATLNAEPGSIRLNESSHFWRWVVSHNLDG
jgi:hypothetical protein